MKTKIAEILEDKGHDVWAVSPDSAVYDAIAMMAERSVGALAVKSEDRLVGIISERDYTRQVILKGLSSKETSVSSIMSRDLVSVQPDDAVVDCMELMTSKRVRHLPVLGGDEEIVGMLSLGDLVKTIIENQSEDIVQLRSYPLGIIIIALAIGMMVVLMFISSLVNGDFESGQSTVTGPLFDLTRYVSTS